MERETVVVFVVEEMRFFGRYFSRVFPQTNKIVPSAS